MTELKAVREVFGDAVPLLSSTKALSGHSLGAASVHEAIYSLLMLNNDPDGDDKLFEGIWQRLTLPQRAALRAIVLQGAAVLTVDAADTRMVLRYQRPNGWFVNSAPNCSKVHGVGHRSCSRVTTWPSDLKAVTAIQ